MGRCASMGNLARLLQNPGSLSYSTHARDTRRVPTRTYSAGSGSIACLYLYMFVEMFVEMFACCTRRLGRQRLHLMPSLRQSNQQQGWPLPSLSWAEHRSERAPPRQRRKVPVPAEHQQMVPGGAVGEGCSALHKRHAGCGGTYLVEGLYALTEALRLLQRPLRRRGDMRSAPTDTRE